MRRLVLEVVSIVIIALSCASISYSILHHLYGERYITTSVLTTTFENYGQDVKVEWSYGEEQWGPYEFSVVDVENVPGEGNKVYLSSKENVESLWRGGLLGYKSMTAGEGLTQGTYYCLEVSDDVWHAAQRNKTPVTSASKTTSETEPVNVTPISSIIGISAGVVTAAVWVGHRHPWGDAVSTLFERGLTNMTIRDVKIFGEIIKLEEFTIPQLMKQTHSSKITVWRALQKLIEGGLVQPTEKSIPSSNGLGGRGKPSRVYTYVGKEQD